MQSSTPQVFLLTVWPLTRSLATTCAISFDFFSSPYLDVSVQVVPLIHLFIQCMIHIFSDMWVSSFRHLRLKGYLLLPAAFRSLSRLSSALSAKASTLRSYSLDLCSFTSVLSLRSAPSELSFECDLFLVSSLYSVITNCVYLVLLSLG